MSSQDNSSQRQQRAVALAYAAGSAAPTVVAKGRGLVAAFRIGDRLHDGAGQIDDVPPSAVAWLIVHHHVKLGSEDQDADAGEHAVDDRR